MIPLFKPFIAPEAAARVAETLASGYIGEGSKVAEFEKALRSYIGENIPVNSGTSALWLAYDLAQVQGATVITTPITCLATNIPLAHMGCTVIWADCDPRTGLIDTDSVKRILWKTPNCDIKSIRAIVGVDYGGQLPDHLETLCSNYEIYGIPLIEDCAHSFGAYGHGKAQFECYSFQAIKHLTTGDGGALCVRDPELSKLARLKKWFGLDRSVGGFRCEQIATTLGYKFHMNDIAASIGLANLPYVNENIRKARRNTIQYDKAGLGGDGSGQPYKHGSSCWLYTLTVPDREKFIKHMEQRGIQCGRVHSSNKPHPIFKAKESHTPGADEFDAKQVSIPVGYWLSEEDVEHIIKSVLEVYDGQRIREVANQGRAYSPRRGR